MADINRRDSSRRDATLTVTISRAVVQEYDQSAANIAANLMPPGGGLRSISYIDLSYMMTFMYPCFAGIFQPVLAERIRRDDDSPRDAFREHARPLPRSRRLRLHLGEYLGEYLPAHAGEQGIAAAHTVRLDPARCDRRRPHLRRGARRCYLSPGDRA